MLGNLANVFLYDSASFCEVRELKVMFPHKIILANMESAGPTTTLILRTCESDPRVRAVDGSRTIEIFYAVVLNVFLCVCACN